MAQVKEKGRTKEARYTKYEAARIIGARALQVSMNAPILMSLKKEELEQLDYDPLKIAELEFKSGILPITVKRPFPEPKESDEDEEEEEDEPIVIPVEEKKDEIGPAEMAAEVEGEEDEVQGKPAEEQS